jgi:hypothetical protein
LIKFYIFKNEEAKLDGLDIVWGRILLLTTNGQKFLSQSKRLINCISLAPTVSFSFAISIQSSKVKFAVEIEMGFALVIGINDVCGAVWCEWIYAMATVGVVCLKSILLISQFSIGLPVIIDLTS